MWRHHMCMMYCRKVSRWFQHHNCEENKWREMLSWWGCQLVFSEMSYYSFTEDLNPGLGSYSLCPQLYLYLYRPRELNGWNECLYMVSVLHFTCLTHILSCFQSYISILLIGWQTWWTISSMLVPCVCFNFLAITNVIPKKIFNAICSNVSFISQLL